MSDLQGTKRENQFAGGYKRHVAEKKLVGEMKMQEGQSPIEVAFWLKASWVESLNLS